MCYSLPTLDLVQHFHLIRRNSPGINKKVRSTHSQNSVSGLPTSCLGAFTLTSQLASMGSVRWLYPPLIKLGLFPDASRQVPIRKCKINTVITAHVCGNLWMMVLPLLNTCSASETLPNSSHTCILCFLKENQRSEA